jgi:5-amino-6-(5-phospho-D-ribitylamino)uracil phosphatase
MNLIFFDLDGTLLNSASEISSFTRETLILLGKNNIAYTVATGRTMLSAKTILTGHDFKLPQIYNNGVTIWDPLKQTLALDNLLSKTEIATVINVAASYGIAPFVHAIDNHRHFIYYAARLNDVEKKLVSKHYSAIDAKVLPIEELSTNHQVTNISMIGAADAITAMWQDFNSHANLVAYSGIAIEGNEYRWVDVHHRLANKGMAVSSLRCQLEATNVICFGDSDNDLSMFELADESYAPANAKTVIKESASEVIGHNHADGVAHFLRERFSL